MNTCHKHIHVCLLLMFVACKKTFNILCCFPDKFLSLLFCKGNPVRQEDVYLRRRTSRIKLSKYAAYNTYHHCEQCHQYLGFNPRYQVSSNSTNDDTHALFFMQVSQVMLYILSNLIYRCMSQHCMLSHSPIYCWGRRSSSTSSSQSLKSTTSASANQEASWRACGCPSPLTG